MKLPLHTLPFLHTAKASEKCDVNAVHYVFLHGAGAPCHPGRAQLLSPKIFYTMTQSNKWKEESLNIFIPSCSFTTDFGLAEEWYHGNLPHRNRNNLIQFVTFRLDDSLPLEVQNEIKEELEKLTETKREVEKRKRYEEWFDKGLGCCALANSEMAQVVFEALKYYDKDKYNLLAWSIMPNHVHVLIETKSDLRRVVHAWKSYTGKWAFVNNEKHRLGIADNAKKFWMPEHWDRFIRNYVHFENTLKYILDNPKNANLERSSAAYKFTGSVVFDK